MWALQGSEQESKGLPCKKGIVQSIVGQGYHRKVILASQSTQNSMYRSVPPPAPSPQPVPPASPPSLLQGCVLCVGSEGQSAAIPVASMEFAAICLRNALLLLPEHQPLDLKENSSRTASQAGGTESGSENSDICRSAPL